MPPDRSSKWMEVLICIISAGIFAQLGLDFEYAPTPLTMQANFQTSLFAKCQKIVKTADGSISAKNQKSTFGVMLGCRICRTT